MASASGGKPRARGHGIRLGVIETPIALTSTLSVGAAFEGLVRHALAGNPPFRAVTESTEEAVVNALLAAEYVGSTDRASGVPISVSKLLEAVSGGK